MDEQTVTGLVTDATDGAPLPGVSVQVPGTGSGTVTDLDGRFSLTVPDEVNSLVFSYVGYGVKKLASTVVV